MYVVVKYAGLYLLLITTDIEPSGCDVVAQSSLADSPLVIDQALISVTDMVQSECASI